MSRRVSLKGRGADLFFGGEEAGDKVPDPEAATATLLGSESRGPWPLVTDAAEPEEENLRADVLASMQVRGEASLQENEQFGGEAGLPVPSLTPAGEISPRVESLTPTALIDAIWPRICDRAAVTNAFRYTDRELSWLTDVVYEVNKKYGLKVSKQDVARLGLLAILHDYQARGEEGLLGALAHRRQRERGQS